MTTAQFEFGLDLVLDGLERRRMDAGNHDDLATDARRA